MNINIQLTVYFVKKLLLIKIVKKMESVFHVRSEDCQSELTKKCEERSKTFKNGDEWTENVRARILFVSDLVYG